MHALLYLFTNKSKKAFILIYKIRNLKKNSMISQAFEANVKLHNDIENQRFLV